MRSTRIEMLAAAQLAAAFAMFPSLTPPARARPRRYYSPKPYHLEGRDTVLMDWDLPKGKRARRRARGRAKLSSHTRTEK